MTTRTFASLPAFDGTAALSARPCGLVLIEGGRARHRQAPARRAPRRPAVLEAGQALRALLAGAAVILAVVLASALAEPARSVRSLEAIDALPTQTVVVQEGDSLWDIARRCGEAASSREVVDWIQERNGIEGGLIVPGQRLVVPVGDVD